ncbi:MAG: hypothetical protein EOO51_12705 [Flavobacterium sp.]|nr:MAG: hypothetical protein EOO51_12705 [Flavobacterium sp.]
MEKLILQNVVQDDRVQQLRDSADKVEDFTYSRELEIGEVQELQSDLSQGLIKIDQEEQKLKVHKEAYKSVVKPIRETIKANLQKVRTQMEEVTEEVYLLKDLQQMKMGYYSKEGKLVFERGLRPDEMQFSITETLKKVN